MGGQSTEAGRLVRTALRDDEPAAALARLRDSRRAVRLLDQLFTVTIRRCFAAHDPRELTRYVRDLLEYRELPARGRLARQTEALLRAALGETGLVNGVPVGRRHEIVCHVVGDVARPPGLGPAALDELISLAGERMARDDEPTRRPSARRRR